MALEGGSVCGRLVADADSESGLTAGLGVPTGVSPFSDVVWELTVREVAPWLR